MEKRTIVAAFSRQKEEEIKTLETSLQKLDRDLREAPKIKYDETTSEKASLQKQRIEEDAKLRRAQECLNSLKSGSLVVLRGLLNNELSTYLVVAKEGNCGKGGCYFQHEGQKITCVSLQAPLGQGLINKTRGATFSCKDKTYQVVSVE